MNKKHVVLILTLAIIFGSVYCAFGQEKKIEGQRAAAESVVRELYTLVSFAPNSTPDWEDVKSLFIDEAVIVLRVTYDSLAVLSKQDFVDLFISDIEKYQLDKSGFVEKIVSCETTEFGDIAKSVVVYEASIPNSPRPPQQGVDFFQLMRKNGRWFITAIVNEVPRPGNAIPSEFIRTEKEVEREE